ncbi:Condensin complex subunit 2 [Pleurotus pulmonarius]|nr:hypothetical protein EYR38_009011 [Pleurotus pulmonarius]
MARKARIAQQSQSLYADDTDSDSPEQETPSRRHLKKRISEAFVPGAEGSFSLDASGSRTAGRAVNINDDAAEKRRRRKSAKLTAAMTENALAGPSSENDPESRAAKQKAQLASVALPQVPDVQINITSANYEEWMKMATDNKINAANSWNFALIDYFHDMSLLRNNDDNSINFQRASCTLDGCVKIWTSRVDSVGTETGKLLSNLANEGGEDDEEGENDEEGPDGEPSQKKKKSHRSEATLVKNPQQLKSKKLDLEFNVDPLFRKTCADFDEGGAQGLLMNHLSLGLGNEGALRVIFDASDSMGVEEKESTEEPEDSIDLSDLRAFVPDISFLDTKEIAHSLEGFAFSKSTDFGETSFFQDDLADDDDDNDNFDVGGATFDDPGAMDIDGGDGAPPAEDFFVGDQAVRDDFYAPVGGGDDYGADNASNGSVAPEGEAGGAAPFVPFDPRRAPNQRDLVMAMTDADAEGGMMDYFDQNFNKNWAGPEHWKMRKVVRRTENDPSTKGTKGKREKKEAFKIDFFAPPEKSVEEITKELFAPATRGTGINLPNTGPKKGKKKVQDAPKRDDHRLPDDMHFSSRQLVTLFLKPKFSLKMRGHKVRFNENGDGEVDQNFWAQAAANEGAGYANDGSQPIPFNTQFFADDDDDGPGFNDDFDGPGIGSFPGMDGVDGDGEHDLLAATQGTSRRVKPEFVKYAKRAKRVDVHKLKDNIWKGLNIVVPNKGEDEDEQMVDAEDPSTKPTDPEDARQFSEVITGLQKSYPRDKMQEISTSFCFICLLHLANEQGLRLESTAESLARELEDDTEDLSAKRRVGEIWDLKIYRDPTATQDA